MADSSMELNWFWVKSPDCPYNPDTDQMLYGFIAQHIHDIITIRHFDHIGVWCVVTKGGK